ncbi:hypothetical protein O3M35_002037 [Rhynocoris fuscipes]|uniref:Cytokine-like nuclear factor N-PAC n=1 Tax=Rhynocoris fuscipes TaxID=488301 RepID=A0AAW1CRB3_9HEMI
MFKRGDLVWAKMKGFPPWPGIITAPPEGMKKQPVKKSIIYHCIFFFGTKDYSWIENDKLEQYKKGSGNVTGKRYAGLREAVAAIDAYIDTGEGKSDFDITPEVDASNKVIVGKSKTANRLSSPPAAKKSKQNGNESDIDDGHTSDSSVESVDALEKGHKDEELNKEGVDQSKDKDNIEKEGESSKDTPSKKGTSDIVKSADVKSKVSPHPELKKKQLQKVVKARPFRHLPKAGSLEHGEGPSTAESSSRKRNSESSGENKSEAKRKKRIPFTVSDTTTSLNDSNYVRRGPAALLLDRPPNISRPDTPPLDLLSISEGLLDKHITPSTLRFGFLGLGIMGSVIVKNLLNSGHRVIIWNRTPDKCREFSKVGAEIAVTPQDVCAAADVIFSCVAGPKAAKDMVFGNCGALREMTSSKAYVEMTNVDTETSFDINEAIMSRGARYLEAQIQGSKTEAEEGKLVLLCAGDRSLYDECHSCFEAISSSSFYLGEVGNATKMNLVIQMVCGTMLAGLAEGMALLDRFGLLQSDMLDVINLTPFKSKLIMEKGHLMKNCSFPTSLALSHMQRDIRLGISCAEDIGMPTPVFAAVNEAFKQTMRMGYGDHDVSAVYVRSRY